MRNGWRKGACFQERGPVRNPGKRGGQPGGGGAAGAAPALSMVFRDATQQPAHTRPRRPQSSIYCPDLAAAELDSTSSALLQKGGCFASAPFSPQGWSCPLPVFRGLLSHSRSSFSVGVFPGPAVSRNYRLCSNHCPDPISQKAITNPRPSGLTWEGAPSTYRSHLGSHGEAVPFRRASPHTGLGSNLPRAKVAASTG